jgi:hypothetical protein
MTEIENRDLLKAEYLHLQGVIEAFDGRALTIKAWSITFSLTSIGAAYAANAWPILIVAALSSLMFWTIEGFWKTFQYAHYDRAGKLEKYFAGEGDEPVPMQIAASWYVQWKKGGIRRLVRIMMWPHVALPHIFVLLTASALLVLHIGDQLTVAP